MTTNAKLLYGSAYGQYIPQMFSNEISELINEPQLKKAFEVCKEGPENEDYLEYWDEILSKAKIEDKTGAVFYPFYSEQGDLWAIPENEINEIPEE